MAVLHTMYAHCLEYHKFDLIHTTPAHNFLSRLFALKAVPQELYVALYIRVMCLSRLSSEKLLYNIRGITYVFITESVWQAFAMCNQQIQTQVV